MVIAVLEKASVLNENITHHVVTSLVMSVKQYRSAKIT